MNKIKQLLYLLVFAPVLALAQSTGENYVMTETVLNSSGGTMKSVQYYNGLGYPTLSVATTGVYGEGDALGSNTNRYSESFSYDANGNIISLKRYGKTSSGYGVMDNLTISYTGNLPTSVSESASDNNTSGAMEYKKANGSGYKFNANGSLVADKSRGIAYITYDFNNNPKQIYFTNGSVTKYVYSASGQKLRAVHYTAKPNITRTWGVKPAELTPSQILQADSTDYLLGGSLTLKNGKVDKYLFDGGYAQASATSTTSDNFTFYYYTPDHLGNVREVVDASGTVLQVTNYYPFGATYADAATNADFQPYKYNGKELDKMHGLNTYDYGARQHDPILARWDRIDPLCEKNPDITPYHYCHNNPVIRIDPNGKADYFTTSGTFIKSDNNKKDPYIYIKTKNGNVRLADYTFSKNKSGLRSMMRVAFHYGKSVGIATNKTSIGVDAGKPKGTDKNTLAYSTNDHHIRLMVKNGHFKEAMSQIYNMRSTLRHESIHNNEERRKDDSEVNTLIREIGNSEFNKTTASFQKSTLGSLQEELVKLYVNDIKLFNNVINRARDILESHGMNGTPIYHDGGNSISF